MSTIRTSQESGAIPPSNKSIEVPACEVFRVEGEKIKSSSHYFDMLTLLKQIGAMERAASAKSAASAKRCNVSRRATASRFWTAADPAAGLRRRASRTLNRNSQG
jgi:SnoaL-like polyketide cyclase